MTVRRRWVCQSLIAEWLPSWSSFMPLQNIRLCSQSLSRITAYRRQRHHTIHIWTIVTAQRTQGIHPSAWPDSHFQEASNVNVRGPINRQLVTSQLAGYDFQRLRFEIVYAPSRYRELVGSEKIMEYLGRQQYTEVTDLRSLAVFGDTTRT